MIYMMYLAAGHKLQDYVLQPSSSITTEVSQILYDVTTLSLHCLFWDEITFM